MKITQVTVSYGGTQSLPEYSNTKVALTLTATLDEGDDPALVERELWDQAKASVHAQIDVTLELNDQPAKYDPGPRYQVLKSMRSGFSKQKQEWPKVVLLLPDSVDERTPGYVHALYPNSRKLRYGYAFAKAQELATQDGATLVDCSDGDLSKIPPMPGKEESPF